jgi:hypothetical protein
MHLRDLRDPDLRAEQIEEAWDAKCEVFPHCAECGESLLPYDTYTELGDHLYCQRCVGLGTHLTEALY